MTAYRRKREHWWINELRTSYPYGLNIRVGSKLCNEENESFDTYKQFHPSKSPSKKRRRRRGKIKPRSLRNAHTEPSDVLTFLKSLLHDDLNVHDVYKKAHHTLLTLPKSYIKSLIKDFKPIIANLNQSLQQKYMIIMDLMNCHLSQNKENIPIKHKKKTDERKLNENQVCQ